MVDLDEVLKDILNLKKSDTSYATCERLALLCIVRDELLKDRAAVKKKLTAYGDSEFLQLIDGKDSAAVWAVIDELMSTLKISNARMYNAIIQRIKNI